MACKELNPHFTEKGATDGRSEANAAAEPDATGGTDSTETGGETGQASLIDGEDEDDQAPKPKPEDMEAQ